MESKKCNQYENYNTLQEKIFSLEKINKKMIELLNNTQFVFNQEYYDVFEKQIEII